MGKPFDSFENSLKKGFDKESIPVSVIDWDAIQSKMTANDVIAPDRFEEKVKNSFSYFEQATDKSDWNSIDSTLGNAEFMFEQTVASKLQNYELPVSRSDWRSIIIKLPWGRFGFTRQSVILTSLSLMIIGLFTTLMVSLSDNKTAVSSRISTSNQNQLENNTLDKTVGLKTVDTISIKNTITYFEVEGIKDPVSPTNSLKNSGAVSLKDGTKNNDLAKKTPDFDINKLVGNHSANIEMSNGMVITPEKKNNIEIQNTINNYNCFLKGVNYRSLVRKAVNEANTNTQLINFLCLGKTVNTKTNFGVSIGIGTKKGLLSQTDFTRPNMFTMPNNNAAYSYYNISFIAERLLHKQWSINTGVSVSNPIKLGETNTRIKIRIPTNFIEYLNPDSTTIYRKARTWKDSFLFMNNAPMTNSISIPLGVAKAWRVSRKVKINTEINGSVGINTGLKNKVVNPYLQEDASYWLQTQSLKTVNDFTINNANKQVLNNRVTSVGCKIGIEKSDKLTASKLDLGINKQLNNTFLKQYGAQYKPYSVMLNYTYTIKIQ